MSTASHRDDSPRDPWQSDDEHTQVLGAPGHPRPADDHTRVDHPRQQPAADYHPVFDAPAPATYPAESRDDVARRDPRGTVDWDLQIARMNNRPLTDLGLLLLRLFSVPLLLHGLHKAGGYASFVESLRGNAIAGAAPELFGLAVVAGQIVLPVFIGLGLLTRLSGLAQAVMMAGIYAFWVLPIATVIDAQTGALSGEAALAYAALALPLFFTGAGRFSVDHLLGASGRQRRAERRVNKRLAA